MVYTEEKKSYGPERPTFSVNEIFSFTNNKLIKKTKQKQHCKISSFFLENNLPEKNVSEVNNFFFIYLQI